jgi:hypothetical protein
MSLERCSIVWKFWDGLVTGIGIERERRTGYHEPWLSFRIGAIRFPVEIIQHAIWHYLRFTLSYRRSEPANNPGTERKLLEARTPIERAGERGREQRVRVGDVKHAITADGEASDMAARARQR